MSIYINSNIASIDAQRNLSRTQVNLQKNLQHLSSGLRINSAADDAAGLSISEQLRAQIRSFDQAGRNANDGISLVQTADGALNQVSGILQRGRELAIESANGTVTNADRAYINQEFGSLKNELDRITGVTSFNNIKVLDGTTRSVSLQVGSGVSANDTIAVNIFGATSATGDVTFATKGTAIGADTTLKFSVAGGDVTLDFTKASDTLTTVAAGINNNAILASYGVRASVVTSGGNFVLQLDGSSNFTALTDSGNSLFSGGSATPAFDTATGLASAQTTAIGYDAGSATFLSAAALDTAQNSTAALKNIDQAIKDISSIRTTLGVSQNRLQFSIDNLAAQRQNYAAADSRIRDVDVASETAELTRNNILSQAGVSILAQANQLPQSALSLLGGR